MAREYCGSPSGPRVQSSAAALATQPARSEESSGDLSRRDARRDRIAEQVAGHVLAVVLATSPIAWTRGALPDGALRRGDPALRVASRSSARPPRAVRMEAGRRSQIEARHKRHDPAG